MGWGCYKHEWDAGSESWREYLDELCERMLEAPSGRTWGRDVEVCPKCWVEMERKLLETASALQILRRENGLEEGMLPNAAYLEAELDDALTEQRSLERRLKAETERSEWGRKLAELVAARPRCPGCGTTGDGWEHRRCCQIGKLAGAVEGQCLAEALMRQEA